MSDQHGSGEAVMMIGGAIMLALAIFLGSFAVDAFMVTTDPAGNVVATR
jgi:hypothetical protein